MSFTFTSAARLALLGWLVGSCTSPPSETPPDPSEAPLSATSAESTPTVTGRAPRAAGGFPSVLWFTPETDRPETDRNVPEPPTEPALMDQYNTAFHPRVLVVRTGQTVQFKNSEDTLHNVHVVDTVTRDTAFNVATPVMGSYDYVFDRAAVYDVSCGIHPSMAAFIVVTETPFAVAADNDGAFSLAVPPGTYTVTVWNLDPSRRSERVVTVTHSGTDSGTELILDGMS